jgi:hypothetical protein
VKRQKPVRRNQRVLSPHAQDELDAPGAVNGIVEMSEAEAAEQEGSSPDDTLEDWPEIAGDVDEWLREHGGRGDEQFGPS